MSRVAVVTGASRGIGAATALLFAQQGFRVVINYRSSAAEADEVVSLDDPLIVSIARRTGKTPAQVLLAWGTQRGSAVLTGSVTPSSPGRSRRRESRRILT